MTLFDGHLPREDQQDHHEARLERPHRDRVRESRPDPRAAGTEDPHHECPREGGNAWSLFLGCASVLHISRRDRGGDHCPQHGDRAGGYGAPHGKPKSQRQNRNGDDAATNAEQTREDTHRHADDPRAFRLVARRPFAAVRCLPEESPDFQDRHPQHHHREHQAKIALGDLRGDQGGDQSGRCAPRDHPGSHRDDNSPALPVFQGTGEPDRAGGDQPNQLVGVLVWSKRDGEERDDDQSAAHAEQSAEQSGDESDHRHDQPDIDWLKSRGVEGAHGRESVAGWEVGGSHRPALEKGLRMRQLSKRSSHCVDAGFVCGVQVAQRAGGVHLGVDTVAGSWIAADRHRRAGRVASS